MRILELEIRNNKSVKAFRKALGGNNLELAGDTGTGKTTAVSALWEIIEKCPDAVTHGEKSGQIKIKAGEGNRWLIAERKHTTKTSTVNIFDQDGKKISIADFKAMVSGLAVNPHKILDMKPTEQVATLLKAASVEIDIDALDAEIEMAEQERLIATRQAEAKKPGPQPEKAEKISVSALTIELGKRQVANMANEKKRDEHKRKSNEYRLACAEAEELKNRMEDLKKRLDEKAAQICKIEKEGKAIKSDVDKLKDSDTSEIQAQIEAAEKTNEKASAYDAWKLSDVAYRNAENIKKQWQEKVIELRDIKKVALDSAKWPLNGLSVKDGKIVYNDVLLSNLGTSEQMLVCAALAIEDIKAHPLKVVRMDGIESMSKVDYESLKGLFNGHGIQVLSTRVSRGDTEPGEIVISEGVYEE